MGKSERGEVLRQGERACPCCGQGLQPPPGHGPIDFSDARPGDGWCEPCHWLVLREVFQGEWALACPTHQGLFH
jgi:hypothetical protein